jgi:hypothetical protein
VDVAAGDVRRVLTALVSMYRDAGRVEDVRRVMREAGLASSVAGRTGSSGMACGLAGL